MNRITNLLIMVTCIFMIISMIWITSLFGIIVYIEWKQNENIKRLVHEYIFSTNDCKQIKYSYMKFFTIITEMINTPKEKILVMTIGISGSGKSTYLNKHYSKRDIVSAD